MLVRGDLKPRPTNSPPPSWNLQTFVFGDIWKVLKTENCSIAHFRTHVFRIFSLFLRCRISFQNFEMFFDTSFIEFWYQTQFKGDDSNNNIYSTIKPLTELNTKLRTQIKTKVIKNSKQNVQHKMNINFGKSSQWRIIIKSNFLQFALKFG